MLCIFDRIRTFRRINFRVYNRLFAANPVITGCQTFFSDFGHTRRYRDLPQIFACIKGLFPDRLQPFFNLCFFQVAEIIERFLRDTGDSFFDHDLCDALADIFPGIICRTVAVGTCCRGYRIAVMCFLIDIDCTDSGDRQHSICKAPHSILTGYAVHLFLKSSAVCINGIKGNGVRTGSTVDNF